MKNIIFAFMISGVFISPSQADNFLTKSENQPQAEASANKPAPKQFPVENTTSDGKQDKSKPPNLNEEAERKLRIDSCDTLTSMYGRLLTVNISSQNDMGISGTIMRHTTLQRYNYLMVSLRCNMLPIVMAELSRLENIEATQNQIQNKK
jgi:hypothetical protein